MKTSRDRILTTHVGSLPRPTELRQLLVAKDKGEPYEKAELARLTRQAVFDIVRRQADTGIDIVNDGEMSRPGYSTYVADRLSGFAGHEPAKPRLDTRDHPNFLPAYERMTGTNVARPAACRPGAHSHLLGQLRGAARPRHRLRQGRADPDTRQADGAGRRGRQPAPRP